MPDTPLHKRDWGSRPTPEEKATGTVNRTGLRYEFAALLREVLYAVYGEEGVGESGRGWQSYLEARIGKDKIGDIHDMTSEAKGTPESAERINLVLSTLWDEGIPDAVWPAFERLCDMVDGRAPDKFKHEFDVSFRHGERVVTTRMVKNWDEVERRIHGRLTSRTAQEDTSAAERRAYYDQVKPVLAELVNALLDRFVDPDDFRDWVCEKGIPGDTLVYLRRQEASSYPAACVEKLVEVFNSLVKPESPEQDAVNLLRDMHQAITGQTPMPGYDASLSLEGILQAVADPGKAWRR